MKDTDHPISHPRVHLGYRASARRRRGCARQSAQFGRGQDTVLGWSDPTFAHGSVAKVICGVAPALNEISLVVLPACLSRMWSKRVMKKESNVKNVKDTHFSFFFSTFFTRTSVHGIDSQRFANTDPCESYRAKQTKSGGSDPTFLRTSRPKVSWGRSRPRRHFASTFCAVASAGARILSDEMSDILYEIERRKRCPF